MNGSMNEETN